MTYEPMHSAQAQLCKSQGKYIFWIGWSPLSRHYKK